MRGRRQWEVFVVHVHGDEVGRVWFRRAYITAMRGGDKDRATGVSSLANEEPLVVVKACVDVVREIIREDRGDGRDGVVGKGKTSLRRGGCRSIRERTSGAEDGYIGCGGGVCGHWESEVFTAGRGDKDVVGVNSDVFVKWSEEEGVEDFLGDLGRGRRHG